MIILYIVGYLIIGLGIVLYTFNKIGETFDSDKIGIFFTLFIAWPILVIGYQISERLAAKKIRKLEIDLSKNDSVLKDIIKIKAKRRRIKLWYGLD